jgi:cytochrome bd-type quinol oxidase subunit 2
MANVNAPLLPTSTTDVVALRERGRRHDLVAAILGIAFLVLIIIAFVQVNNVKNANPTDSGLKTIWNLVLWAMILSIIAVVVLFIPRWGRILFILLMIAVFVLVIIAIVQINKSTFKPNLNTPFILLIVDAFIAGFALLILVILGVVAGDFLSMLGGRGLVATRTTRYT